MRNSNFDEWFEEQDYADYDGCYQEKYLAAKDAWDEQEARIKQVIARLESYPACMTEKDFRARVVGLWEELL
jgi:broad specificity phosphatase PhoE